MTALLDREQFEFATCGLVVKFPFNPYPPQKAMMAKIIKALSRGENALLESPTGTGKSLSLLCSAIAWQQSENISVCRCKCHLVEPSTSPAVLLPPVSASDAESTTSSLPHDSVGAGIFVNNSVNTSSTMPKSPEAQTTTSTSVEAVIMQPPQLVVAFEDGVGGANKADKLSPGGAGLASGISEEGNGGSGEEVRAKKCLPMPKDKLEEHGDGDDDGGDFKIQKKRFRVPVRTEARLQRNPSRSDSFGFKSDSRTKKMKRKVKGVVYEDVKEEECDEDHPELAPDSSGHAKWRMEMNTTVGLGIPQSQIMDSGAVGQGSVQPVDSIKVEKCSSVVCHECDCSSAIFKPNKSPSSDCSWQKCSKIFFATRTHKQIDQLIRELNKTAYRETSMCILASREHTCIHPAISKSREKNDDCKKLLMSKTSCRYYLKVHAKLGTQAQLRQLGLSTAWDIEDLVQVGRRVKACPYFSTRSLVQESDIIFCPYNYIIDPIIRDQMLIDLTDKVVILDEAHNMEDTAREAASLSVSSHQIDEVIHEIEEIVSMSFTEELKMVYENLIALNAMIKAILRWVDMTAKILPARGYEQAYGVWTGPDFLPILEKEFGINTLTLETYKGHLKAVTEAALDRKSEKQLKKSELTLSTRSINFIKSILVVMSFIFRGNQKHLSDYRMSLVKSTANIQHKTDNWHHRSRRKSFVKSFIFTLNFWCLNPAVAFSELMQCRSIVLTSGTLSPLTSFASELGVSFPVHLEANHVIHESQTWIKSFSHGPNGVLLSATYQNSETLEFKDELGALILGVCETIPYGILCFMSSYKMLDKMTTRWQETGLWNKILVHKKIVCEPKTGGKEVFEGVMATFYEAVASAEPTGSTGHHCCGTRQCTGALFFAVCRGKVSEGLDFTDNNARAVITVGIPFPNIKDKQIELKKEYNNEHTYQRGLLSGKEWYDIQAYRALNQALGRCIRHKQDWGALLLVDARYSQGAHYIKGLSKWIRQRIQHEFDFKQAMVSLRAFSDKLLGNQIDFRLVDSKSSTSFLSGSPRSNLSTSIMSTPPRPPLVACSQPLYMTCQSSHFTLNSPASAIPDCFHVSEMNQTSRDMPSRCTPPRGIGKSRVLPSSFELNWTSRDTPVSSTPVSSTPVKDVVKSRILPSSLFPNGKDKTFYDPFVATALHSPSLPIQAHRPPQLSKQYPAFPPIQEICSRQEACADVNEHVTPMVIPSPMLETFQVADESFLGDASTEIYCEGDLNDSVIICEDLSVAFHPITPTTTVTKLALSVPDTPPKSPPLNSPMMFDTPALNRNNPILKANLGGNDRCAEQNSIGAMNIVEGNDENICHLEAVVDRYQQVVQIPQVSDMTLVSGNGVKTNYDHPDARSSTSDHHMDCSVVENNTSLPLRRTRRSSNWKSSAESSHTSYKLDRKESVAHVAETIRCPCGKVLTQSASVEKMDLYRMFSKEYGRSKIPNIQHSKLRNSLVLEKAAPQGNMDVLLVPARELNYSLRKDSDEGYNSMWEEGLGICYSLVSCLAKCEHFSGAIIHATKLPTSDLLIEKVILPELPLSKTV